MLETAFFDDCRYYTNIRRHDVSTPKLEAEEAP